MSIGSQCFICIFAVLINNVCLQITEEGFIGGSVILQCYSNERPQKEDINVHWRGTNGKIVYDIIKGEDSLEKQDQQYNKRTVSFPVEYLHGNFSIKLINLTHADAGEFSCFISHASEENTVLLRINETKSGNGGEKPTPDVGMSSTVLWVCSTIGILSIGLVAASFFVYRRRKKYASSSCVTTDEMSQ